MNPQQVLIILVLFSNFETIVCGSFFSNGPKDLKTSLDTHTKDLKSSLDKKTKHCKHTKDLKPSLDTDTKDSKSSLDKETKHSKHTHTKDLKPSLDTHTKDLKPSLDKESKHCKHTHTKDLKPRLDTETKELKPPLDKETKDLKPPLDTDTKDLKPSLDKGTKDMNPSLEKETDLKPRLDTDTKDLEPSLDKGTKDLKPPSDTETKDWDPPLDTKTKDLKPSLDKGTKDLKPPLDTETKDWDPPLDTKTKDLKPPLDKGTKDLKSPLDTETKNLKPRLDTDTKDLKPLLDTDTKNLKPLLDTDTKNLKSSLEKETKDLRPSLDKEIKVWNPATKLKFTKALSSLDFEPIGKDCVPDLDYLKKVFQDKNEDRNLDDFKLLTKNGLIYEVHFVKTCDGFILTVVRIPGKGPVVLLNHGLICSFIDFFTSGTTSGLGYILHNAGYDLWFANCRGNTFSKNHTKLSPEDKEFWNFSWHEIGTRDLPALIDYALCKTGEKQLTYIGHSQGTTSIMVLLSKQPEYNKKLKLVIMLSPVAFMNHAKSPILRLIALFLYLIQIFVSIFGHVELLPRDGFVSAVRNIICYPVTAICSNMVFLLSGFDWAQLNHTALPTQYGHVPSGVSTKQVMHYAQGVHTKRFCEYDYGEEKNLEIYGEKDSPDYNLSNIRVPVAIFRARNDWLADPRDVRRLLKKLPNVVLDYLVPFHKFNHMDFLWAKDAKKLVYMKILEVIEKFNNNC